MVLVTPTRTQQGTLPAPKGPIMRRIARLATATTLSLALLGGFAHTASAQTLTPDSPAPEIAVPAEAAAEQAAVTPLTLDQIKVKGHDSIVKRQLTIQQLTTSLAAAKFDCGFNAQLATKLQGTSAGLAGIDAQLAVETDLTKARAEYQQIFGGFRVYLLLVPQAEAVLGCDHQATRVVHYTERATALQVGIDKLKARGVDTTAAQSLHDAAVNATQAAIGPKVAAPTGVINLVPDNGDKAIQATNAAAVATAKANRRAADASLDTARANLLSGWSTLKATRPVKVVKAAK
jgi:hypothetical protein